jgi:uncharacterized cysteine cluster protein YcgN (CxxCxxCC family)
MSIPDWLDKPLAELSASQWESLCDGCGKCCMAKLQDADTDEVFYTNVACTLFDEKTCRCQDYAHRTEKIPTCINLSLEKIHEIHWLPQTCAYNLRLQNKALPEWHPLISGKSDSVHAAGISMQGKTVNQKDAGPLVHHIVDL